VLGNEVELLPRADLYVGVDSGALHLVRFGLPVDIVVGDLDSLRGRLSSSVSPLWIMTHWDKDTTDSDIALDTLHRSGVSRIYMIGLAGFELDHVLGNLTLFRRWYRHFDELVGIVGQQKFFRFEGEINLRVNPGTVFSIVPDAPRVKLTIKGAKWEVEGAQWTSVDVPPISNIAVDNLVYVRVELGGAFIFVGRQT